MIKTIFCDLDGVIRHWDNQALFEFEHRQGLSQGFVFSHAFAPSLLSQVITGKINHDEWHAKLEQHLAALSSAAIAKQLMAAWRQSPFEIDDEFMLALKQFFPDCSIILVTNATSDLKRSLEGTAVPDYVDLMINSSEIGHAKPDAAFYEVALQRSQALASESIFIDDSLNNCEAATALGICAIHFQNKDAVLEALAKVAHPL